MRLPKAPDFRHPPVPCSRILLGASLAGVLTLGTGAIVVTAGAVAPGEPDARGASPLADSSPLAPVPDESMSAPAPDEDMVRPSPEPTDAGEDTGGADGRDDSGAGGGAAETIRQADPRARVYVDAGHSTWHSPADVATWLAMAGLPENDDGIATNISNVRPTGLGVAYAKAVLTELGDPGVGAVIDTSRNGSGPLGDEWCAPGGRRLGPTTDTGDSTIGARPWVKPPGEADGCATAAGAFSPDLAFELASGT